MADSNPFDIIIIGGGPAGLSAALWCDELKLNALLLEKNSETGGQLLRTYNRIENHLGIEAENGAALRNIFVGQLKKRNFELRLNATPAEIDFAGKTVRLESGEEFTAGAMVIATGVRRRTLGVEGEQRFAQNGILRSGKLERDAVGGKRVLIVGGGDAALENSLILAETAERVYVAHRREEFRAREEFLEAAGKNEKIAFLPTTVLKRIAGNERIETVELEDLRAGKKYSLPVDAVLFRIGVVPNSDFPDGLIELDRRGYIKIDGFCRTNLPGVYAVGDVANPVAPTVSSAVGMGATAVKAIYAGLE